LGVAITWYNAIEGKATVAIYIYIVGGRGGCVFNRITAVLISKRVLNKSDTRLTASKRYKQK